MKVLQLNDFGSDDFALLLGFLFMTEIELDVEHIVRISQRWKWSKKTKNIVDRFRSKLGLYVDFNHILTIYDVCIALFDSKGFPIDRCNRILRNNFCSIFLIVEFFTHKFLLNFQFFSDKFSLNFLVRNFWWIMNFLVTNFYWIFSTANCWNFCRDIFLFGLV